jgi:hypothetical protein
MQQHLPDTLIHDASQVAAFGAFCAQRLEHSKEGNLAAQLILFSLRRRYTPNETPVMHRVVSSLFTTNRELAIELSNVDARTTFVYNKHSVARHDMMIQMQLNPRNQMHALHHVQSQLVRKTLGLRDGWKSNSLPSDVGQEFLNALGLDTIPCDRQATAIILHTNQLKSVREFCAEWTDKERADIELVISAPDAYYIVFRQANLPHNTHRIVTAFRAAHPSIVVEWECTGMVPVPGTLAYGHPVQLLSSNALFEANDVDAIAAASFFYQPDQAPGLSPLPNKRKCGNDNDDKTHVAKEARHMV